MTDHASVASTSPAARQSVAQTPARAVRDNRSARCAVTTYYDQCRNDYRILWRSDETGSLHFGFFDEQPDLSWRKSPFEWARSVGRFGAALLSTLAAALLALLGTPSSRERAVRCLRFAARGRSRRHDEAQARMTDVCAQMVRLNPADRVLDAGCGVGGTDLWLTARYGVTVHGINVQRGHMGDARRRALASPNPSRVTFSVQDFTQMGIATERVTVVWALESVCHTGDKEAFIAEAYRVLRRGGRLLVGDFFLRGADADLERQRVKVWTEGWALPGLASVDEFRSALAAHGFHHIVYRDIAPHIVPSSRRLYKASLIALPAQALLERIGARSAVQGRNVRAAREQYSTLREGAWTYGIFVAEK